MNFLRFIELCFNIIFLFVLPSLTYFTNPTLPLFEQSQKRSSTLQSRVKNAVWNVIYIGTGNLLIQWMLPKLSVNLENSFLGVSLFDLYKIGLYLWILFIITPLFGEWFFMILNNFSKKGAKYLSYIFRRLQSSTKYVTEENDEQ